MMVILLLTVFEGMEFSTVARSMGGASYAIDHPVYSLNPATTGMDNGFFITGEFTRLYHVVDMGRMFLGWKGFALQVFYRGVEDLQSETEVVITRGVALGKDTRVGFNLKGFYLYQERFGGDIGFGLDIGIHTRVWRMWKLGAVYTNINTPSFGENTVYYLPAKLGFSIAYNPDKGIYSSFGIEKETGGPVRFMFGQAFDLNQFISVRAGFHTAPFEPSFGIGINVPAISFNFTYVHHAELGPSYTIGVDYK